MIYPATAGEIETEINNINSSKSVGPYSIPINLLKTLKSLLSKPLAHLFNCSFLSGVVPDKLKVAGVIPVFKKGPRTLMTNYRPISLLSIFNKLLEKLMYNSLMVFSIKMKCYIMDNLVYELSTQQAMPSCLSQTKFKKQLRINCSLVESFLI